MKKLIDIYKSLKDKPLREQTMPDNYVPSDAFKKSQDNLDKTFKSGKYSKNDDAETLMVKLGGDEKTELKISNQTDSSGNVDLSNVTLEFKGEKIEKLNFTPHEMLEDHENEGQDWLFTAEDKGFASSYTRFEVEVNVQYGFEESGNIEDVEWRSLETFPTEMDEQQRPDYADVDGDGDEEESMEKAFQDKEKLDEDIFCTEEELKEGTCGYGIDGKIGRKPAGPHLMRERFQKLANIIK